LGWDNIDPDLQKKALSALATVAIPFVSISDTSIWKRCLNHITIDYETLDEPEMSAHHADIIGLNWLATYYNKPIET
jgi:hypothetical protein